MLPDVLSLSDHTPQSGRLARETNVHNYMQQDVRLVGVVIGQPRLLLGAECNGYGQILVTRSRVKNKINHMGVKSLDLVVGGSTCRVNAANMILLVSTVRLSQTYN